VILKEGDDDPIIFIDTEGSERAAATEPGKLQDRIATDEFLIDTTILLSDVILYWTGPLRGPNQPMLHQDNRKTLFSFTIINNSPQKVKLGITSPRI
jgi:hypothetical protein